MAQQTLPKDFKEPTFARWLLMSTSAAWILLVARLYVGYEWLHAGWEKLTGTQAENWYTWHFGYTTHSWLRDGGASLKGFAAGAVAQSGHPYAPVNYGWYAAFLRWIENTSHGWMAWVVTLGEVAIGLGLIVGCLTGIAAFFGLLLTFSFGLAGVAGVNPVMFLLEVMMILAWRNSGWIGLDRYVLPALGTPWQKGRLLAHVPTGPTPAHA